MPHVAEWKYKEIEQLLSLIIENNVIGIAEISNIPAPQMQHMRANIYGNVIVRASKNSLISLAIQNAEEKKPGIINLKDFIKGQTAIIATNINPFKLYGYIKSTRTMAPAKGGEITHNDIVVKEGDTPFKPGPVVGELQKVGIPAAIQEGKVIIKNDKVVVKTGDKIPRDLAQMLTRLEIFPIEIGMSLHGVYEDGNIFKPDMLDLDLNVFRYNVQQASQHAFTLAKKSAWVHPLTIQSLLINAHFDALSVALETSILNKQTIQPLLVKACRSMFAFACLLKDEAKDAELKKLIT